MDHHNTRESELKTEIIAGLVRKVVYTLGAGVMVPHAII